MAQWKLNFINIKVTKLKNESCYLSVHFANRELMMLLGAANCDSAAGFQLAHHREALRITEPNAI